MVCIQLTCFHFFLFMQSIAMIQGLKNFDTYETFAYHISLLRQFVSIHARNNNGKNDEDRDRISVHGNNVWASLKKKRGLEGSGHGGSSHRGGGRDPDESTGAKSLNMGIRRVNTSTGRLSSMA